MLRSMTLALALVAIQKPAAHEKPVSDHTPYRIRGEQVEACECEVYCPCVFQKDATLDQCRGVIAWRIAEGTYGKTDLKGLQFAAALTKSGKNLEKVLGHWEGVAYVSDKATDDQKKAVQAILESEFGPAFGKLEVKTSSIAIQGEPGHYDVSIGKIATVQVSALKGANGQVPVIENAPSPIVLPKLYCARADVHTYDDGTSKWDFAGHNAFYGPFEFKKE